MANLRTRVSCLPDKTQPADYWMLPQWDKGSALDSYPSCSYEPFWVADP